MYNFQTKFHTWCFLLKRQINAWIPYIWKLDQSTFFVFPPKCLLCAPHTSLLGRNLLANNFHHVYWFWACVTLGYLLLWTGNQIYNYEDFSDKPWTLSINIFYYFHFVDSQNIWFQNSLTHHTSWKLENTSAT